MDSLDETEDLAPEDLDYDVDGELEEWLRKEAIEQGVDPNDLYSGEAEVIKRWQASPNPEDFEWLYNTHQGLLYRAGERFIRSAQVPKNAVKGSLLRGYVKALETYDPAFGTKFSSHLYNGVGRTGRYLQRYTNVGRIQEERGGLIGLLQQRENELKETLGRSPTDHELADDMLLSAQDTASLKKNRISAKVVGTLRKEIRQDLTTEMAGGAVEVDADSKLGRQIVFLHGSLNPEQQLVLEHTFEGFGKPVIEDDLQLAQQLNLSPQKIRSLKGQIKKKVDRFW